MAHSAGVVSVVLVNFRGVEDTLRAIEETRRIEWPADRLEIVVVENGSGDDSLKRLASVGDDVVVVASKENLGFAGGCNLGVSKSTGEYVAFLNNDARPDGRWIASAVDVFEKDPAVGAVASRVLDWDGKTIDYVDAGVTWYGMGYKPYVGAPAKGDAGGARDVLFGTGAAMFVRRNVYEALGGFDERFFMFFEDVDFGWRLNLLGWRFRYEPTSVAFHKHHASMKGYGEFKERYLLERNALFTLYKNLGDEALTRALPAALALAVRRGMSMGDIDTAAFDLRRKGDEDPTLSVSKESLAVVFGIDQFVEALPWLTEARAEVQDSRVVSDARLKDVFRETDIRTMSTKEYVRGYENIMAAFGIADAVPDSRVLIVTGDTLGAKMAGPAIRAWNMATVLSRTSEVALVTTARSHDRPAPFEVRSIPSGDERAFRKWEQWADVIIFQGHAMTHFESLRQSKKVIVVDIYDPMHLEQLEQARELSRSEWVLEVENATAVLNDQMERGDFFLCASERQRHLYLGQLAALGRLNPATYATDPNLSRLLAVVPFGLDETFPSRDRAVLKGVHPAISSDDKLLLWSGGLYSWFDPATLIRAVAGLSKRHPNVHLFFQGTKHPHPDVPEMEVVANSRELARELGVLDTAVIFNDSWVDYNDRHNYLSEADAGVSTHFDHVETTFSFRTRILDYLWAGLPMVVTEGDGFADLVTKEGLGIVVPERDVDALEAALERVLFDKAFAAEVRNNVARVRQDFTWERVLAPLSAFVRDPHHAADYNGTRAPRKAAASIGRTRTKRRRGLRRDLYLAMRLIRTRGVGAVWVKVRSRLRLRRQG